LIAELLERDAEALDEESRQRRIASQAAQTAPSSTSTSGDQERLAKIEADYISQMAELRLELRQAKQTEEHLRDDRNNCRQTAWCLQSNSQQGDDGDEQKEGEEEEIPPSESLTDLGPGGGGGGGGDDDDDTPSRRYGHLCGDPSGPPPDAPDDDGEPEVMEVKISRREADKVVVPPFPRVTHLDSWMSHCIANVLSACADPNHKCWISLLQPNPDIEGTNESGHLKFKSIDVKFGVAMTAMLKSTGDNASDLYLGVQIIAVMYESLDMIATLGYLIKIQYQRDEKMNTFKQTWLEVTSEVIGLMRPEDVLSDTALRDTLHSKIKESPALKMEIFVYYDMLNYDDPKRSYQKRPIPVIKAEEIVQSWTSLTKIAPPTDVAVDFNVTRTTLIELKDTIANMTQVQQSLSTVKTEEKQSLSTVKTEENKRSKLLEEFQKEGLTARKRRIVSLWDSVSQRDQRAFPRVHQHQRAMRLADLHRPPASPSQSPFFIERAGCSERVVANLLAERVRVK
ncbi:unnamed protein product, partial [Symbiodinium microadriaticum]